jgi:hypothetical protein
MLLHQLPITRLFEGTKGPDNDLPQVQGRISLRSTPPSFPVLPPGTIQRRGEIVQNKLQPLKIYTTWAPGRIHPVDTSYQLDKDAFDHLFERAKERAGLPNAPDEAVRNYLRGAIENLVPKITRNYKVAIPVYYVEEKRMQLLLPFLPATGDPNNCSCFLVERDDDQHCYRLKTIFDLDQAYFSARLITRPDKEWLNP